MFGLPEALMSFIRRQVGLRTDAADPVGSLHAKVKDIVDTQLPQLQKPRGITEGSRGSFSTSQSTYQTALDITGRGRLVRLWVITGQTTARVKITVDGNVLVNEGRVGNREPHQYPNDLFYIPVSSDIVLFNTRSEGGDPRYAEINFNTSLKLEIRTEGGPYMVQLGWLYEIED